MGKFRNTAKRNDRAVQREVLFRQQNGRCVYCGCQMILKTKGCGNDGRLPKNFATLDHKLARALGGTDRIDNLVVACHACNNKKSADEYRAHQVQIGYRLGEHE